MPWKEYVGGGVGMLAIGYMLRFLNSKVDSKVGKDVCTANVKALKEASTANIKSLKEAIDPLKELPVAIAHIEERLISIDEKIK